MPRPPTRSAKTPAKTASTRPTKTVPSRPREWREEIAADTNLGKRPTGALRLGTLGIHLEINGEGWAVTHVPSGLAAVHGLAGEMLALRVMRWLWVNCCLAFVEEDPKACAAAVPRWVVGWLRRCRSEEEWVDPEKLRPTEDER